MLKLEECTNRVKASANVEGGGTSGVESVWLEISYLSPTREIYINDMSYDPCGKKRGLNQPYRTNVVIP